jgi:hypothetical protein
MSGAHAFRSSAKKTFGETFGETFGAATGVSDPRLQKTQTRNNHAAAKPPKKKTQAPAGGLGSFESDLTPA